MSIPWGLPTLRSNWNYHSLHIHQLGKIYPRLHCQFSGQVLRLQELSLVLWEYFQVNHSANVHANPNEFLGICKFHRNFVCLLQGERIKEDFPEEQLAAILLTLPPPFPFVHPHSPRPPGSTTSLSCNPLAPSSSITSQIPGLQKWDLPPGRLSRCLLMKCSYKCVWKNKILCLWWYNHENSPKSEQDALRGMRLVSSDQRSREPFRGPLEKDLDGWWDQSAFKILPIQRSSRVLSTPRFWQQTDGDLSQLYKYGTLYIHSRTHFPH